MADAFKGIITADGKKRQLPYRNVLETPVANKTLDTEGAFADAKVVGDKFKEVKTETNSLKGDIVEKKIYIEKNVQVTDGERGHRTLVPVDLSQPLYIEITPTTTNTFNVFLTYDDVEYEFLTAYTIPGGTTHSWTYNFETIRDYWGVAKVNAFNKQWYINIRNATNSKNYKYTTYTKENEKLMASDKVVYVANGIDNCLNKISYAVKYLKAKYNPLDYTTIKVLNGVYEEQPTNDFPYAPINIADTNISIIGESRDNVIVNLTNSNVVQSRIMHIGGHQTVSNMTLNVLADSTYNGNNGNNPYVIHNDDTFNEYDGHYTTTVENCILYSECCSPVGAGLHGKQTQIYKDVTCIYNGQYDNGNGALYIHGASNAGQIPDGVIIDNCTAISKNGALALSMSSVSGFTPYTETPTTIRRTILATNGDLEVATNFKDTHLLTNDSKLNSNNNINY